MRVLTWNIQWCRGVDGHVDPSRIVAEIRRLGDFDVVCLQEVVANFPAPALEGNDDGDQFTLLAAAFPHHVMVAGCAVDHPAAPAGAHRRRFGNAILSRLPVGQVFRHSLPRPLDPGVASMPRIALEAVVDTAFGGVRVITTHLEYFSPRQRMAQVDAIRALYAEGHAYAAAQAPSTDGSPFHAWPRPAATLVCGDFNMPAADPAYARMGASFADGTPPLVDAWTLVGEGRPQGPTFCVHKPYAPGMQPYACDFVFVNAPLAGRVTRMAVDGGTQASDHQPVMVDL